MKFKINTDYNESNDFYPQSVISEKRMIMRGKEILSIDLVPFEYNLNTKNLTVYDEIEITIEETSNRNVLSVQLSKQSETFNNMYNKENSWRRKKLCGVEFC